VLPGLRQCLNLDWDGTLPHTDDGGKLNDLARRTNRGTDELLEQAIEHLVSYRVSYNEWLDRKIRGSRARRNRVKQ
jgi:hypothetical protein